MDIKNILNNGERKASNQPKQARRRFVVPPPPSPPPLPSTAYPTAHYEHHRQQYHQLARPPPLPPQHIVYTAPVYQIHPTVEVSHIGNTVQYRYASYPPFGEVPRPDYAVYREIADVPYGQQMPQYRELPHSQPISRQPSDRQYLNSISHRERFSHRAPGTVQTGTGIQYSSRNASKPPRTLTSQEHFAIETSKNLLERARSSSTNPPMIINAPRSDAGDVTNQRGTDPWIRRHDASRKREDKLALPASYAGYVSSHGPENGAYRDMHSHSVMRSSVHLNATTLPSTASSSAANKVMSGRSRNERFEKQAKHSLEDLSAQRQPNKNRHSKRDFSGEQGAGGSPLGTKGHQMKKRERRKGDFNARTAYGPDRTGRRVDVEDMAETADDLEEYAPYDPNFLRAPSVERSPSRAENPPAIAREAAQKTRRAHVKDNRGSAREEKRRERMPTVDTTVSRKGRRDKANGTRAIRAKSISGSPKVVKNESSASVGDDSAINFSPTQGSATPGRKSREISTSEVIVLDDDTPSTSDRGEGTSTREQDIARSEEEVESWCDEDPIHEDDLPLAKDPLHPYPKTNHDFSGIPPQSVGDLVQLWEFIGSFSKVLRLTSFKLYHLEQAIVHKERSSLLDACLVRLTREILGDAGLVDELGIPTSVVRKLTAKGMKNAAVMVLSALPRILLNDSDDIDEYDRFLNSIALRLSSSSDKHAFYHELEPVGRLRILRELVGYVAMTDKIRNCVADTMEHAEEERKKAREANSANRKRLEQQVRDTKAELQAYRMKHGLIESQGDSEKEKEKQENKSKESENTKKLKSPPKSRKEKMIAAQEEKRNEEARRVVERGEEAILAKLEKDRAAVKNFRNLRLRSRNSMSGRDGELYDESIANAIIPFTALHDDPVRSHPIGRDRQERCYWFFEGSGRVWIEDTQSGEWCTLDDEKGLDSLIRWLSPSRQGERRLRAYLTSRREMILLEMARERKELEVLNAELAELKESSLEILPRVTRAGKRKAETKLQKAKAKRSKTVMHFLDYRNLEK